MRLFVDTNVWVAAYAAKGLCRELIAFAQGRSVLLCSPRVLEEFEDVLVRKLKDSRERAKAERDGLRAVCEMVAEPGSAAKRSRDPKDDAILQAALDGGADFLITGDADLLVLDKVEGLPIIQPRRFLEIFEIIVEDDFL